MVTLTILVIAQPNNRRELLSACRLIAEQVRSEAGALDCRLSQDVDNENAITIETTWKRRAHLDDHLCTGIFSALLGAVKLLGESHNVQISDGHKTGGVEAVEAVRQKNINPAYERNLLKMLK